MERERITRFRVRGSGARVDVLKDAASAAIYGLRGANGVIIITTKRSR